MHVSDSLYSLQGMGYSDGPGGEQTTPSQGGSVFTEVYNQNLGYRFLRKWVQDCCRMHGLSTAPLAVYWLYVCIL